MISPFIETYSNRHKLAKQWKAEGKKIFGYIYSSTPEELIYAAGIVPVQITEDESREMADKGEEFLPEFFCDYVHSAIGQVVEGVYDYLDGIVIPDNCTHIRTLAELWFLKSRTPFFYCLRLPSEDKPHTRVFFREELQRFVEAIEGVTKQKITNEALRHAIEVYNANRDLMSQLYELRKKDNPPIAGSEVFEVVKAGVVLPKEEHNGMLRDLLERIGSREGKARGRVRLMVSSVAFEECTSEQANFVRLIEELGGNVVCDDLIIGHRYYREPVQLRADLMEALIDRYLGKVPIAYRMSAEDRVGLMLEEAIKYKAKGAIVFIPKYCQTCEFHYLHVEERFREKGIPTMLLETQIETPEAPLKTRVQAFLEMLG